MSRKKRFKLVVPDQALKSIPPEEHAELKAEIEAMFKDFDPKSPPGTRVQAIAWEVKICPGCEVELEHNDTVTLPEELGGGTVEFLTCPQCDTPFERHVSN